MVESSPSGFGVCRGGIALQSQRQAVLDDGRAQAIACLVEGCILPCCQPLVIGAKEDNRGILAALGMPTVVFAVATAIAAAAADACTAACTALFDGERAVVQHGAVADLDLQGQAGVGPGAGQPVQGAAAEGVALLVLRVVVLGDVQGVEVAVLADNVPGAACMQGAAGAQGRAADGSGCQQSAECGPKRRANMGSAWLCLGLLTWQFDAAPLAHCIEPVACMHAQRPLALLLHDKA